MYFKYILVFSDQFDWYDVLVVSDAQCHFFSQSCNGKWDQCGILLTYHQRFCSQYKTCKPFLYTPYYID